jgi:hypothetical protein
VSFLCQRFPFCIPERNSQGDPWGSSDYGPGNEYCIPVTGAQLFDLYWNWHSFTITENTGRVTAMTWDYRRSTTTSSGTSTARYVASISAPSTSSPMSLSRTNAAARDLICGETTYPSDLWTFHSSPTISGSATFTSGSGTVVDPWTPRDAIDVSSLQIQNAADGFLFGWAIRTGPDQYWLKPPLAYRLVIQSNAGGILAFDLLAGSVINGLPLSDSRRQLLPITYRFADGSQTTGSMALAVTAQLTNSLTSPAVVTDVGWHTSYSYSASGTVTPAGLPPSTVTDALSITLDALPTLTLRATSGYFRNPV